MTTMETPEENLQGSSSSDDDQGNNASTSVVLSDVKDQQDSPVRVEDGANGSPSLSSTASTVPASSPPRTPLGAAATTATSPSQYTNNTNNGKGPPTTLHLHPRANTPQMMVLGRDGSDYRDMLKTTPGSIGKRSTNRTATITTSDKQQALLKNEEIGEQFEDEHANDLNSKSSSSKWWGYLWAGKSSTAAASQESSNSDDYASMEQVEGAGLRRSKRKPPPPPLPQQPTNNNIDVDVESPVYYQDLEEQNPAQRGESQQSSRKPMAIGKMHQSILRNLPLPTTKEDQIQQDCSFLYRPVDEQQRNTTNSPTGRRRKISKARNRLRAVLNPPPQGVSTLYRDAQDVLSPPAMAQFHAKYHQLNQAYKAQDENDRFKDYNDYAVTPLHHITSPHDLTLEEQQQQIPRPSSGQHERQHSYVTDVASQSSLFYQNASNGRVMLRLPRDHVHLLEADASVMEPGILSVIQNRPPGDDNTNMTSRQHLEYCLTVPPNLYQRVVSEMTHCSTTNEHGEGLDLHIYASDHVDIKVAIGIMAVIMLILGINTLIFGLD